MRETSIRQPSERSFSASDSVSTSSRTASGSCEKDAAHRSAHNSIPVESPVVGRSTRHVPIISVTNPPPTFAAATASKAIARRRSQRRLTSASGVRKSASFVDRVNSTRIEFRARGECLLRRARRRLSGRLSALQLYHCKRPGFCASKPLLVGKSERICAIVSNSPSSMCWTFAHQVLKTAVSQCV